MVQLHAVSETPRRVLGAIRVSKERDGMVSPDIQVAAITDYCAARGYVLAGFIEGLDESGSQGRSSWWKKLDQAVGRVADGDVDGIVVWKFSRTARHRLKWAVALDRVEAAGGVLESATEQFDTTTSAGRFARGMVAEMNAFEAERIGEVWKESQARRARDGRPHSGRPRWGYTYDRDTKTYAPNVEQGPVLADMYRRYIAGESIYDLIHWLNSHGWKTSDGNPWRDRGLRRVLDSGFAAGKFTYQGKLRDGAHQALIDDDTWQAYLDARRTRAGRAPRAERSDYLLSGMVRCAECGSVMVGQRSKEYTYIDKRRGVPQTKRARTMYACPRGAERIHASRYVASEQIETRAIDFVRSLADSIDQRADRTPVAATRRSLAQIEERRLATEVGHVDTAMVQLALRDAERPMPTGVYEQARATLEARLDELKAAHEVAARELRRGSVAGPMQAARLMDEWDELPIASRREIMRTLIDCVLVGEIKPGPRTRSSPPRTLRVVEWTDVRPEVAVQF